MNHNTQPNEHLSTVQLDAWVWDKMGLPASAAAHLAFCEACQRQLARLEQLAADLTIMRRSQPSLQALERYNALFVQQEAATSPWRNLAAWAQAALRWDSRQQLGLAGVRSVGTRSYRVIYSAPAADIELWIVPQATTCSIEGDCILNSGGAGQDGPLVQLHSIEDDALVLETTASGEGRFQFMQVPAGVYDLWITPDVGQSVVIERLALP